MHQFVLFAPHIWKLSSPSLSPARALLDMINTHSRNIFVNKDATQKESKNDTSQKFVEYLRAASASRAQDGWNSSSDFFTAS